MTDVVDDLYQALKDKSLGRKVKNKVVKFEKNPVHVDKMFVVYSIKAPKDIKKGEEITIRYYGIDKTGNPMISIDFGKQAKPYKGKASDIFY